ncbi:hypothetical protein K1T73_03660 [Roseovarius sp. SCSIO 43702]|uniref:hypothetical protein n=1 Tax=Roseovarius sp. SCSIO 43702 TaxID=2823043 RepID=UPI001C73A22F|nr:hypothetical protein [Roseovarius sp. SCSIO 43702]QYX57506.1 hypothetical protein K1T73_03660 [Roseovarius sp. SCSIO 43702]
MPLEILVPMVVLGIAGIAFLLHMLNLTDSRRLGDDDAVRAAWEREFPERPARSVTRSTTGRAALVETEHGRGLVWCMGADTVVRALDDVTARVKNDTLILTTPDYGARRIRLHLAPGEAEAWARAIGETT